MVKEIVVLIGAYYSISYVQNFIQHLSVKVKSIYRGKYWGPSVWISTQQVKTDHNFCSRQVLEKKWECNKLCLSYL
jgi:hypothetical protein